MTNKECVIVLRAYLKEITETFEAIKALEKSKKIPVPVARWAVCGNSPRLLFKPSLCLKLLPGSVYALNLRTGDVALSWPINCDTQNINRNYERVTPQL